MQCYINFFYSEKNVQGDLKRKVFREDRVNKKEKRTSLRQVKKKGRDEEKGLIACSPQRDSRSGRDGMWS